MPAGRGGNRTKVAPRCGFGRENLFRFAVEAERERIKRVIRSDAETGRLGGQPLSASFAVPAASGQTGRPDSDRAGHIQSEFAEACGCVGWNLSRDGDAEGTDASAVQCA